MAVLKNSHYLISPPKSREEAKHITSFILRKVGGGYVPPVHSYDRRLSVFTFSGVRTIDCHACLPPVCPEFTVTQAQFRPWTPYSALLPLRRFAPKSGFSIQCGWQLHVAADSVREYVFYVFFRFQKNITFYVFLKWPVKKNVKSR